MADSDPASPPSPSGPSSPYSPSSPYGPSSPFLRPGLRLALLAGLALWTLAWVALDKSTLAANDLRADAGLFALGGRLWAEGRVPYREFWDNKPPGIFAVMATLWRASANVNTAANGSAGDIDGPARATDRMRVAMALAEGIVALATVAVFAALAFGATGRTEAGTDRAAAPDEDRDATTGWFVAFAATGLFAPLSNCWIFTEGGGLTETWLILPDTLAAYFAVHALRAPRPERPRDITLFVSALACGVATATAFVFKPIALAPAAGLLAVLLLRAARARALRPALAPTLLLFAGIAIGLAPSCLWMAMHGALRDCVFASLGYNFSYVAHGDRDLVFLARRTVAYLGVRCLAASAGVALLVMSLLANLCSRRGPGILPVRVESDVLPGLHSSDAREDSHRRDACATRSGRARSKPDLDLPVFALAWLAFALAGAYAGGYGYGHYFLPAIAPLVFAGALGWIAFLGFRAPEGPDPCALASPDRKTPAIDGQAGCLSYITRFLRPERVRVRIALFVLALTILPTAARQVLESARARATFAANRAEDARTLARLRESHPDLSPGDPLLVLDHHFAHYLDGGFAPALRMLSTLHAAKSPLAAEELLRELESLGAPGAPEALGATGAIGDASRSPSGPAPVPPPILFRPGSERCLVDPRVRAVVESLSLGGERH